MRTWSVLLLLVSLAFSGSSLAQGGREGVANKDQIYTSSGEQLSLESLASRVQQANYVFVGEKHDNPQHHAIERELIRMRFAAKNMPSGSRVVFEMLDESQDNLIAKLQATMSLDEMKVALNWPQKGWDWASYGPLFWESMQYQALSSGNISRALISSIYKDGKNVLSATPRLASALQQNEGIQKYLLDQIYASHCGMQSRESLQPMLHIQLAKDASMASVMVSTPSAMLIAGGEHTRGATGVPQHVQQLKPNASRLIIQLVERKADKNQAADYFREIGGADIIWLTEAMPEKDYCADVKGRAAQ